MNELTKKFNIEVAKYIERISNQVTVRGIVLTGSAGRGDYDRYSDIDNVVFVVGVHTIKEGKFVQGGFTFDTRIVQVDKIEGRWSDDMYFAYLNSSIVYDKGGIIRKLFDLKAKDWSKLVVKKLSLSLVNLSVIYEFKDDWKFLRASTHYQKFLDRRDYLSAHRLLNSGFEIVLDIFYLINSVPIPDSKNKLRLLNTLESVPDEVKILFPKAFTIESFSTSDLEKRYKILDFLILYIKKVAECKISLPSNLYGFYLAERE